MKSLVIRDKNAEQSVTV